MQRLSVNQDIAFSEVSCMCQWCVSTETEFCQDTDQEESGGVSISSWRKQL